MGIRWSPSAEKHGVERRDVLHALEYYVYRIPAFDEPRVPGGARPDLFIGPARDRRQLLEVMVEVQPPTDLFIFHAMPARQKIIDIAERNAK